MKNFSNLWISLTGWLIVAVVIVGLILTRAQWMPRFITAAGQGSSADEPEHADEMAPDLVAVSAQALRNMGLTTKAAVMESYWRTIQVPGIVVERPGVSDHGVTSPAMGVIAQIHAFPGDTVNPGEPLFTISLVSDYLQNAQSELFTATRETQLLQEEQDRLTGLARDGSIPEARIIDLDQRRRRQEALIQAHRQDLLSRGLSPAQLEQIAEGQFVSTIDVIAPPAANDGLSALDGAAATDPIADQSSVVYEIQEMRVTLGEQVQAGQLLTVLSNHLLLYIEGHAFKKEAPLLEKAAQQEWPLRVEFTEDDGRHWPPLEQEFRIRHLANTIDAESRTFAFYVPLSNQSRDFEKDGRQFVVWRFRPGQRVRLHVPIEKLAPSVVVPAEAVVRDGPEAFVFRQTGELFQRIPVHVLYEDRLNFVLAQDEKLGPGMYLAQTGAASLNRILKAQRAGGSPSGMHVHADGTVHDAH
jgi:multidrug efflux pump subunit AcrA (membrane-fusion protein)